MGLEFKMLRQKGDRGPKEIGLYLCSFLFFNTYEFSFFPMGLFIYLLNYVRNELFNYMNN